MPSQDSNGVVAGNTALKHDDDVNSRPSSERTSLLGSDRQTMGGESFALERRLYVIALSVLGMTTLVLAITVGMSHRQSNNSSSTLSSFSLLSSSPSPWKSWSTPSSSTIKAPKGPYELVECQEGEDFFDFYDFYDGLDSSGSGGYNVYVGKERAEKLGLFNVTTDEDEQDSSSSSSFSSRSSVFMKSAAGKRGEFRESLRLEGKRRFDHGLFILDVEHMPTGCGVWPAFWMTDEETWPDNGEIDIVEGVNDQSVAKTALHTRAWCSMYSHVPVYTKTGVWDSATGIPDTFTGIPNMDTKVQADNCYVMTPHQWFNQGCVIVSTEEGTIGAPLNAKGGGVYVLEWDPANKHIRSWVFTPHEKVPPNLQDVIRTARQDDDDEDGDGNPPPPPRVRPDPSAWGLPYAYFAIGEGTGCSADHFHKMRLVFNLAFCGMVAGNRYFADCPAQAEIYSAGTDPVASCNVWMATNPKEIDDEAYWKIRGVYVYERTDEE